MALVLLDRAKETTTVVGTGTATLLGAVTSYQSLAGVGNGNTTYYCIVDQVGANWEVGIGTYTSAGTTLARTTVLASSNAGALVVFTTGVKDVFVTYPSEKGVWYDASGNVGIGTSSPGSKLDIGSGNLNFSGTAQRITGDMSTTPATNRLAFQTSTANANTNFTILPNGTSVVSSIVLEGDSAQTNGSFFSVATGTASNTEVRITSGIRGTGTYLPITMWTGGSEKLRLDTSGNVGIGVSNPSSYGILTAYSASNPTITIASGNANAYLRLNTTSDSNMYLTNTGGSMTMNIANTERMRIDYSGNVGIGTSSPSTYGRLAVMTPTATYGYFGIANSSGGGGGLQMAQYYGTTKISYIDSILSNGTPGSETAGLAFATASVGTLSEKMRIDSAGNVGIGRTPTSFKLEIQSGLCCYTTSVQTIFRAHPADGNGELGTLTAHPQTFITNSIERMRIDSSGNLLVGTTVGSIAPTTGFTFNPQTIGAYAAIGHSTSAGSGSYFISFGYNGGVIGTITQNGTTAVAYNTSSDQRLKENIIDAPSALASVNAIKVRSFDWKVDGTHQDYGYIAQELLEVAPEAVSVPEDENQMMGVDFGKLTPRLVKAIQELKAIIDTQQEQINSLLGK